MNSCITRNSTDESLLCCSWCIKNCVFLDTRSIHVLLGRNSHWVTWRRGFRATTEKIMVYKTINYKNLSSKLLKTGFFYRKNQNKKQQQNKTWKNPPKTTQKPPTNPTPGNLHSCWEQNGFTMSCFIHRGTECKWFAFLLLPPPDVVRRLAFAWGVHQADSNTQSI